MGSGVVRNAEIEDCFKPAVEEVKCGSGARDLAVESTPRNTFSIRSSTAVLGLGLMSMF